MATKTKSYSIAGKTKGAAASVAIRGLEVKDNVIVISSIDYADDYAGARLPFSVGDTVSTEDILYYQGVQKIEGELTDNFEIEDGKKKIIKLTQAQEKVLAERVKKTESDRRYLTDLSYRSEEDKKAAEEVEAKRQEAAVIEKYVSTQISMSKYADEVEYLQEEFYEVTEKYESRISELMEKINEGKNTTKELEDVITNNGYEMPQLILPEDYKGDGPIRDWDGPKFDMGDGPIKNIGDGPAAVPAEGEEPAEATAEGGEA